MQFFGSVTIIVNYVINKEYISRVLCINRHKPKMRCNGKCHLMKQLQKETKKEKSPSAIKVETPVQFFQDSYGYSFFLPAAAIHEFPDFLTGEIAAVTFPVFHPPAYY